MDRTLESRFEERSIQVPSGVINLDGDLRIPENARGVVLFAHGSGSSRYSSRNRYVAEELNKAGFATLLIDLLTQDEEEIDNQTGQLRFNINLLAERLIDATQWLAQNLEIYKTKIAYFGASTGAAAALVAAAQHPNGICAIVSRGGRPDLAEASLSNVQAPTLLIVGERDTPVIRMNQEALEQLQVEKKLAIVPEATHLFEEPGTLEAVARLSSEWFEQHLVTWNR
ncbi:alpha/beta hydrolase [Scytonema sp. UIC 10036]|uniref:dienelactone hydrolase family protein n=1 Tax=Scytonema sp. UIC 10036 TaxID=2304196 RepID=UPI0012DAB0C7|nr:alpha/beta hydrolase [Scytonema sp. UIC 10036]MUG97392.1 alpha/beta hydrolase [Scytonema sp. UIC 10036]